MPVNIRLGDVLVNVTLWHVVSFADQGEQSVMTG